MSSRQRVRFDFDASSWPACFLASCAVQLFGDRVERITLPLLNFWVVPVDDSVLAATANAFQAVPLREIAQADFARACEPAIRGFDGRGGSSERVRTVHLDQITPGIFQDRVRPALVGDAIHCCLQGASQVVSALPVVYQYLIVILSLQPYGWRERAWSISHGATSIAIRARSPAARKSAAHRSVSKIELPAKIGAVREQGRYRGPGIALVPGQSFVDRIEGIMGAFKRAHVVVLLCLVPQSASKSGFLVAAASPACSQYVPDGN